MIFNRFNVLIVIQVLLIGLNTSLLTWVYSLEYMMITRYSLIVVWLIQIILLINFVQKTNRELNRFLQAIKFNDTTIQFNHKLNSPFSELYKSFEEVIAAFGKLKIEKESEYIFFQATIQHLGVGVMAFDEGGQIKISNKAMNQILDIPSIINIKSLNKIKPGFEEILKKLKPGIPELYKLRISNELKQISIKAASIKIEDQKIKLVSFQDIRNEIEQGEMDAWQKLIRIMTHEILNSVSPITLLSSGLINNFETKGEPSPISKLDNEKITELLQGLKAIQNRSKGLSGFVEDYRSSMQIPYPHFKEIKLTELFTNIETLFKEEFKNKNIKFRQRIHDNPSIMADQKLIEMVLINLINNAIHFSNGVQNAQINLEAEYQNKNVIISVSDNGPGIEESLIEQIFIPFFSTKENGSGIGLSLSRQIMRMHKGNISVQSSPHQTTTFTLTF
jgi:two-component system, NtrC family, nitrogen regulation sensor histidine kinase NtrY